MDFKYKTVAEISAMTDTEKEQYMVAKRTHDDTKQNESVKTAVAEAKKEFADEIKAAKDEADKANTRAEDLAEQFQELKNARITPETIEKQVADFIEKNHDTIKSIHAKKTGVLEFEVKVVANMTTGSATNPDGIPALVGVQVAPPGNVNLRTPWVLPLTNNINTSLAAYPYTETVPKDGSYLFVAEGVAKPQIDFKIETRYATPVKVAAWIRLTDESVQDIPGLQSIATDYLRKKHDLKKQNGILFGDGISPNPKGAIEYARAFSAGEMAGAIQNPNMMDVINALATDIYTTHNYEDEMEYMPSLVALNPVDFFVQFTAAKDGNGLPLYPTASLFNTVNIGGMTIIPTRDIPAGKIFAADMSKYNTTNYVGYTVQIGWINDDFIKNQFVILGESRFHAFVKKLDEQAFIYDDIATIKTAITYVAP